mgnify:FL=1
MKRLIRDLLMMIYGGWVPSYSGRTRTWYVNDRAFPVNLKTYYRLAKRAGVPYIANHYVRNLIV